MQENQTSHQKDNDTILMLVHEMRNPLTNINLASECIKEMVAEGKACPSVESFISIIVNNANRVDQLLRTLLAPQQQMYRDYQPVDVCAVIDSALEGARDRLLLRGVEIEKDFHPCAIIMGNKEKLSMTFLNIIINAVEAMTDTRQGKLIIKVYRTENKTMVVFKDNGCGMDQDVADKIFNLSYTNKPGGIGIGLGYATVNSLREIGTSIVIRFKSVDAFTD